MTPTKTSIFRTASVGSLARSIVALATVLLLTACGFVTPLDRSFGLSQREHATRMIANPEAGVSDLDAPRPDGPSTGNALYKFRTKEITIDESQPESVINIEIGN